MKGGAFSFKVSVLKAAVNNSHLVPFFSVRWCKASSGEKSVRVFLPPILSYKFNALLCVDIFPVKLPIIW